MEQRSRRREAHDTMATAEAIPLAAIGTSRGPGAVPEAYEAGGKGAGRIEPSEAFLRFDTLINDSIRYNWWQDGGWKLRAESPASMALPTVTVTTSGTPAGGLCPTRPHT